MEDDFDYNYPSDMSDDEDCSYEDIIDDDYGPSCSSSVVPSIKVITEASLLTAQREDLLKVMEVLGVKEHHARTLLIHHRWDYERLLGIYVERGKECLFSQAGVTFKESAITSASLASILMCGVCIEEMPKESFSIMDCGHYYCNDCWTEYFSMKIQEGQSKRLRCMHEKCNAICDEEIVRDLVRLRDPLIAEKFERFLLESYIEDNNKVKWCPSIPNCGNAIRVDGEPVCEVECKCGSQFCFNCLAEAHSPCTCKMWKLWDKKCRDESETVNWLTVHTKSCPKCEKPVEKNGGCNLVSCICGQAFCWLCGAATGHDHTWTSIRGHECGRYKEEKEKESEKAERVWKRYIHYNSRWKAHIDSLKLEAKQRRKLNASIEDLERKDSGVRDYTWLTNGLHKLFRARRALAYSYPFAFYMFGEELFGDELTCEERETKQHLFEDQQQQLEQTVETLSKLIEGPFEDVKQDLLLDIRMKVINLTVLADTWCKKMYDVIENDLLGSLVTAHHISPYNSRGVEKASELTVRRESLPSSSFSKSSPNVECLDSASPILEEKRETTMNGASGCLHDKTRDIQSACSKRKRSRDENTEGIVFDLNMPADVNDALDGL